MYDCLCSRSDFEIRASVAYHLSENSGIHQTQTVGLALIIEIVYLIKTAFLTLALSRLCLFMTLYFIRYFMRLWVCGRNGHFAIRLVLDETISAFLESLLPA
jgi:hypothetical protein